MLLNPIIIKDYKIKMRSFRVYLLSMVYVGILGAVLLEAVSSSFMSRGSSGLFAPKMVLDAYVKLAVTQYILIILVTPVIALHSVFDEKEKHTIDLLLCTGFSPRSVILGKFVVSVTHILILIVASIPVMSIVFLYGGGISISNIILLFALYILTAALITSICMFYSTKFKERDICYVLTYATEIAFIIIANIITIKLFLLPAGANDAAYPVKVHYINPFSGFISLLGGNSLPAIGDITNYLGENAGRVLPGIGIRPWMAEGGLYLAGIVSFAVFAMRNILPVGVRPLIGRKRFGKS